MLLWLNCWASITWHHSEMAHLGLRPVFCAKGSIGLEKSHCLYWVQGEVSWTVSEDFHHPAHEDLLRLEMSWGPAKMESRYFWGIKEKIGEIWQSWEETLPWSDSHVRISADLSEFHPRSLPDGQRDPENEKLEWGECLQLELQRRRCQVWASGEGPSVWKRTKKWCHTKGPNG